jgi:glycosyl transferase family 2
MPDSSNANEANAESMRTLTDVQFSLIIPSRGRATLLLECLDSFFTSAAMPKQVEAIVVLDHDDAASAEAVHDYVKRKGQFVCVLLRPRRQNMVVCYYNYGAQASTGRYVWVLNDECLVQNAAWDRMLADRIDAFLADKPDRLIYVAMTDDTHLGQFAFTQGCCFPILSREVVDAQNGIFPQEMTMWGADITEYEIFTCLPENRILRVPEIELVHRSPHNGRREADQTANEIRNRLHVPLSEPQKQRYIDVLSALIVRACCTQEPLAMQSVSDFMTGGLDAAGGKAGHSQMTVPE